MHWKLCPQGSNVLRWDFCIRSDLGCSYFINAVIHWWILKVVYYWGVVTILGDGHYFEEVGHFGDYPWKVPWNSSFFLLSGFPFWLSWREQLGSAVTCCLYDFLLRHRPKRQWNQPATSYGLELGSKVNFSCESWVFCHSNSKLNNWLYPRGNLKVETVRNLARCLRNATICAAVCLVHCSFSSRTF